MKMLIVNFSNGNRFEIPAEVIAKDRASYYADKESDSAKEFEQKFESELEYALENDSVVKDWASNNMDWDDVKDDAVEIGAVPVDKSAEWTNATKKISET